MTTLWFDCETYSECDLKAHGTHRYAEDPSTCITVAQWAIDDREPVVLDCTDQPAANLEWMTAAQNLQHAVALGLNTQARRVRAPSGNEYPSIAQAARAEHVRHRTAALWAVHA